MTIIKNHYKLIYNIMKYIKEYKDIDWDDWDIEEDDPNTNQFKYGDVVHTKTNEYVIVGRFKYFNDIKDLSIDEFKNNFTHKKNDEYKHPNSLRTVSKVFNIHGYSLFTIVGLWPIYVGNYWVKDKKL